MKLKDNAIQVKNRKESVNFWFFHVSNGKVYHLNTLSDGTLAVKQSKVEQYFLDSDLEGVRGS